VVGEMGLAVLAAVDLGRGGEVDVVREPHGDVEGVGRARGGLWALRWLVVTFAIVRSGHGLLVVACHTSCWLGVEGDKSGKELGPGAFAAAKFVARVVAQERDHCAGCGVGDGPGLEAGVGGRRWSGTGHVHLDKAG
jgi:hypothetical protein